MREGKTKHRARRFSVVVVPQTTNGTRVISFSSSYGAALAVAAVVVGAFLCAGVFTLVTYRDNHRLRAGKSALQSLNKEQTQEIRRLGAAAIAYNSTIKSFTSKYDQIAKTYLSNQGGAACTSAADCARIGSVTTSGAKIESALRDLSKTSSAGSGSSKKLASSLSTYLSSLPTEWPTKGTITSSFGARVDPFSGGASFHPGLDISAPQGALVVAAGSGVVTAAGNKGDGYGNKVVISHGSSISTLYGHLSAVLVHKGEELKEGSPIGRVGSTGRSTGDHLHFEIRVDGTPVNPLAYLASKKKQ